MRAVACLLPLALAACQPPGGPRLETGADSLAFRVTEGAGGLQAWESLPGLAWEWAVVRDSVEQVRRRHVWDRRGDRARVEWRAGQDSVYVAVFSPSTFDAEAPEGRVALNGAALAAAEAAPLLADANGSFVNDGYWLLAPLKVLDPGVVRAVDRGTGRDRLALTFEGVGLTPGDRYWIDVEPVTGSMTGWSYTLEGGNSGEWEWTDPILIQTPRGPVTLSRTKVSRDGQALILTEPTALTEVDDDVFTDLRPRLR